MTLLHLLAAAQPLDANHLPLLQALERACLEECPRMLGAPSQRAALRAHAEKWPGYQAEIAGLLATVPQHSVLLGVWDNHQLIGYAYARYERQGQPGLSPKRYPWWLKRLLVHPAWHGQGYGKALLQQTLHALAKRGGCGVALQVYATQTTAIRLYEAHGFRCLKTEVEPHHTCHTYGASLPVRLAA